jgi:hypothetical protein
LTNHVRFDLPFNIPHSIQNSRLHAKLCRKNVTTPSQHAVEHGKLRPLDVSSAPRVYFFPATHLFPPPYDCPVAFRIRLSVSASPIQKTRQSTRVRHCPIVGMVLRAIIAKNNSRYCDIRNNDCEPIAGACVVLVNKLLNPSITV